MNYEQQIRRLDLIESKLTELFLQTGQKNYDEDRIKVLNQIEELKKQQFIESQKSDVEEWEQ